MSTWVKRLQKSGFLINEAGFLNLKRSKYHGWKITNEGTYGIILSSGDKILKINKFIKSYNKFDDNNVRDFNREVKFQKMVYECTKNRSSLTPKIFAYGKNWILMKRVTGKTIWDWYISDRRGVFQKAIRAYIKALQIIHKKCGIGHFDAHGNNAVYDEKTKNIKIIDWGFAAPINRTKITKEGLLKRYKEVLKNKLGSGWEFKEIDWITRMKMNPLGQYAIEVVPYNTRFKQLKPKENVVDFMLVMILRNTDNFPSAKPITQRELVKGLFSPSLTPSPAPTPTPTPTPKPKPNSII